MKMKFNHNSIENKGFTLLELSIALVIMAALSYTLTLGVGVSRDYDKYRENAQYLEKVREALLTFVQTNGYLPCPDASTIPDGEEDRPSGLCKKEEGYLPYKILGVNAKDAWDQPVFYAVNSKADSADINNQLSSAAYFNASIRPNAFFTRLTLPVGLTSGAGNLRICGETATGCSSTTPDANLIESQAIAVVVSYGKNGAQTWKGATLDKAETENRDGNNNFWQATGSEIAGNEFDDQLIWLTGYDVKYALLRSERGLQ